MRGNTDSENRDTFRRNVQDCDPQDAELRMEFRLLLTKRAYGTKVRNTKTRERYRHSWATAVLAINGRWTRRLTSQTGK